MSSVIKYHEISPELRLQLIKDCEEYVELVKNTSGVFPIMFIIDESEFKDYLISVLNFDEKFIQYRIERATDENAFNDINDYLTETVKQIVQDIITRELNGYEH